MNKAILVIDMPNSCSECPCISLGFCNAVEKNGICKSVGNIYDKPNWCPLCEVPKRKGLFRQLPMYDTDIHYEQGYNACIDEIMKGNYAE